MGDVEELVAEARAIVARILRLASAALRGDAEVIGVQRIVFEAGARLEDVETYALLAGTGGTAEVEIQDLLVQLRELEASLLEAQGR